jgi:hypothetical protein
MLTDYLKGSFYIFVVRVLLVILIQPLFCSCFLFFSFYFFQINLLQFIVSEILQLLTDYTAPNVFYHLQYTK